MRNKDSIMRVFVRGCKRVSSGAEGHLQLWVRRGIEELLICRRRRWSVDTAVDALVRRAPRRGFRGIRRQPCGERRYLWEWKPRYLAMKRWRHRRLYLRLFLVAGGIASRVSLLSCLNLCCKGEQGLQ